MARFRILLNNRNFVLYSIGQTFSQFADRLVNIALIGFVYKRWPGSSLQLAKIMFFTVLPSFLISPVAGVYIDRWDKKRVLIVSDVVRAGSILLIPALFIYRETVLPIYAIIFVVFASACFFLPARLAMLPDLVSKDEILIANSASSITWVVAGIIGFSFGGVLAEWIGVKKSLYLNALVYILSAISFFLLLVSTKGKLHTIAKNPRLRLKELKIVIKKTFLNDLKEGLKTLVSEERIRFVAYISFILSSLIGAFYVVCIAFIQRTLLSMTKDVGVLSLCLFCGILAGSFAYGKIGQRLPRAKTIFIALIITGLLIIGFATGLRIFRSFWIASSSAILLGLFVSPIYVTANTIVHESIEENLRGRIFSSLGIIMNAGFLIFMFISSFLAEHIGKFWVLVGCGMAFALYGLISLLVGIFKKTTFSF